MLRFSMKSITSYKAVIFDFDDTLVKTIETIWAQHKYTAKKFYDIDLTDETLREFYGKPFDEMVVGLYEGKDSVENMKRKYDSTYSEKFYKQLFPGALEVVNGLLSQDKQVGILTSGIPSHVDFDLPRLGFPYKDFIVIQTQDDTDFHKPDPRVFDPTLEKLVEHNISNSETVYVGDAIRDFEAARDAGLGFVGVPFGTVSKEEFEDVGANVIRSLVELLP